MKIRYFSWKCSNIISWKDHPWKTKILPILAIFSWKYLIFSLFKSSAFEWDKKGLKSYIYVCHGSMHHKNSTLVSKMNSSSDSQITQLGKSFDLNNRFFLIQKTTKIVQKEKICDGNKIMKAFTRKSHHFQ